MVGGTIEFPQRHSIDIFSQCVSSKVPLGNAHENTPLGIVQIPTQNSRTREFEGKPLPSAVCLMFSASRRRPPTGRLPLLRGKHNGRRGAGPLAMGLGSTNPALPLGCRSSYNISASNADDDDAVSAKLAWPLSLHCSGAGLTAVPHPLPPSLEYMYVLTLLLASLSRSINRCDG